MFTIINVLELPSKYFWSMKVNLEFLYGTKALFWAKAFITSLKAVNDLFMH